MKSSKAPQRHCMNGTIRGINKQSVHLRSPFTRRLTCRLVKSTAACENNIAQPADTAKALLNWYSEWSQAVEDAAWTGAQEFNGVMVKKQCEHKDCSHFRCEKNLRLGGIEI